MTAWNIEPGTWEITQGIDSDGDENADTAVTKQVISLERTGSLPVVFPPRRTTVLTLKLQSKSIPSARRPDLGIGTEDILLHGNEIRVKVHSLGSEASPPAMMALVENDGVLASAPVPAIEAPLDLIPRTADVSLAVPAGADLHNCGIQLDPEHKLTEITRLNNRVDLSGVIAMDERPREKSQDQIMSLGTAPRPEHIGLNVRDPAAVANWYTEHLGMKVMRRSVPPSKTEFIGDSAGTMTLELTGNAEAPVIDLASISHASLHLAFMVDDVKSIRDSLLAAGAKLVADITTTPQGDQVLMLRDPWGMAIQLVQRVEPMLKRTGLRFEHLALNVPDPLATIDWYIENLGMKIMRQGGPPGYSSFMADGGSNMMLEIGASSAAPYLEMSKLDNHAFHFAFVVDDVRSIRTGLIEAGATLVEDIRMTNAGDQVLVLRDPWGFPIQFIQRSAPLLK
jgi:catechol 2,3-dioxygenase-like lactoylglutathione lyase family enzyme